MTDDLQGFPKGAFTAFSTAKMSYFLPMHSDITRATIDKFFGEDSRYVALTPMPTVELHLPNTKEQIARPGDIIARFVNGKYKVIDAAYYHKNFNEPLVDKNEKGLI